jgi:cytochrome c-type biogenesis protein CcmH
MRICFLFLLLLTLSLSAAAVEPGEMLKDPMLEARAREISKNLRCLVCQGEAIDDSNADFAKDLRLLVRTRLAAGDTDAAVVNFLRDRYGDFILLKPPLENKTLLLWLTPFLVLGAGLCAVFVIIRRKS